MDALQLLKKDHRTVEKLFKDFERHGERAGNAKRKTVDAIIRELSIHAAIEEAAFYPAIRRKAAEAGSGETDHEILESLEEHHIVKWTLSELQKMSPSDERFDAKVTVLIESVRHHVRDEEKELFPEVRELFDRKELRDLGRQLETAKGMAPTRPHPRAPDQPPFNVVSDIVSAVVDRGRDALGGKGTRTRGKKRQGARGRQARAT